MHTPRTAQAATRSSHGGFSLLELVVAMGITTGIMAGTFAAMQQAMRSAESARLVTSMNSDLRIAMDLLVRDLIQTGQGLPVGNRIQVPYSFGATAITRPGPKALTFTAEPSLPAVSVGPELGDAIGPLGAEKKTDMITLLMADGSFNQVMLRAVTADGSSGEIVVALPADSPEGIDIDADPSTSIREGDLIMLTKGSASTLLHVTDVDEAAQKIVFGLGDKNSLNLNQFEVVDDVEATDEMLGTINQVVADAPVDPVAPETVSGKPKFAAARATRIRMITYYIDKDQHPQHSVLMRQVNAQAPTIVAFGVENLRLTYDIVNTTTNPTNVRMIPTDLAVGGACGTEACSPDQIMKVNVILAARSREKLTQTRTYYRNTLFTQVSMRSLAFVDRYQ